MKNTLQHILPFIYEPLKVRGQTCIAFGIPLLAALFLSSCRPEIINSTTRSSSTATSDTSGPLTVTLNQHASQADPATSKSVLFTAVFSSAIDPSTFTSADVSIAGTASIASTTITDSGNSKTFTVTIVASSRGTVIPTISAGGITKASGSGTNAASTSTDNSVTLNHALTLSVPIEMIDAPISSRVLSRQFLVSKTVIDYDRYDGVTSMAFEIVATNTDGAARNVSLVDNMGTSITRISVPANTLDPTRFTDSAGTLNSGVDSYFLSVDGTTTDDLVIVHSAKIIIHQTDATISRIYFPMISGLFNDPSHEDGHRCSDPVDVHASVAYAQGNSDRFLVWKKEATKYGNIAGWSLDALVAMSGAPGGGDSVSVALYNKTTGTKVANSGATAADGSPTYATSTFTDTETNFTDGDEFEVRHVANGGVLSGCLLKAGLWIELTSLTKAAVYHRAALANSSAATEMYDETRTVINWDNQQSDPLTYFECTGREDVALDTGLLTLGAADDLYVGDTYTGYTGYRIALDSTTRIRSRSANFNTGTTAVGGEMGYLVKHNMTSGTVTEAGCFIIGVLSQF